MHTAPAAFNMQGVRGLTEELLGTLGNIPNSRTGGTTHNLSGSSRFATVLLSGCFHVVKSICTRGLEYTVASCYLLCVCVKPDCIVNCGSQSALVCVAGVCGKHQAQPLARCPKSCCPPVAIVLLGIECLKQACCCCLDHVAEQ